MVSLIHFSDSLLSSILFSNFREFYGNVTKKPQECVVVDKMADRVFSTFGRGRNSEIKFKDFMLATTVTSEKVIFFFLQCSFTE